MPKHSIQHVVPIRRFSLLVTFGAALTGCSIIGTTAAQQASSVQNGVIPCFAEVRGSAEEKPPACELSAVAAVKNTLVFANDKPMPDSAVFSIPFDGQSVDPQQSKQFFTAKPFNESIKYEALAVTPDGNGVFASTAFDRYTKDKTKHDVYNKLLYWPAEHPEQVSVVAAGEREGVVSSSGLRDKFLAALRAKDKNIGYFKIEGLAALPHNKLLFGIREIGTSYDQNTRFTIKLIETDYAIEHGAVSLPNSFELVYDFKPKPSDVAQPLGLSSVEYDPANDRLYLLTSFETGETPEAIGAYLWTLPLQDMRANKPPTLVRGPDSKSLVFKHKAEGLAVLGENRLLIVHDDDRVETVIQSGVEQRPRKFNESAFEILQLQ